MDFFKNLKSSLLIKKIWWLLSVVLIVILVTIIKTPKQIKAGRYRLDVEIHPIDAIVTIDGQKYGSKFSVDLLPGKYTITYERFGFESVNYVYELNRNNQIYSVMNPVSDEAKKWQEQNSHLYERQEEIAQQQAVIDAEIEGEKYPILEYLPKNTSIFRLGNSFANDGVLTVIIRVAPDDEYNAINYLKRLNIDLSPYDYQVFYNSQTGIETNPFKRETMEL